MLSEKLGKLHFWSSIVAINGIFMPMLFMGMAGVSRRLYDQTIYAHGKVAQPWNVIMSYSAWALAVAQLPFLYNMMVSWKNGKKVTSDNTWCGTTLEWAASSPPPHENFPTPVEVYREPYQYTPDHQNLPQFQEA